MHTKRINFAPVGCPTREVHCARRIPQNASGEYHVKAQGNFDGRLVGFSIVLGAHWESRPSTGFTLYSGTVALRAIGDASDAFVDSLAARYNMPLSDRRMLPEIAAQAVGSFRSSRGDETGYRRMKYGPRQELEQVAARDVPGRTLLNKGLDMKQAAAALISFFSICADAADGTLWVREAPAELRRQAEVLARTEYHEIIASRVEAAEAALSEQAFASLSEREVAYYAGESFKCVEPAKPFLVRVVCGHRGTGGYYVQRLNSAIFVIHSSLGRSTPRPSKSALVVCSREVQEVFPAFGVAE